AGGESALLDKMMNGVNICTTGCTGGVTYGAIGTSAGGVPQTAALQMRSSATFNTNLAIGNWSAVAGSLNTMDYTTSGCPAAGAGEDCNVPAVNDSVVGDEVLRM